MPYLYTTAEETSHDGVPIDRPLFLEFPHATNDGTPYDLTAGASEFLFGSRILVAPNPSPEEVAPYAVHLPPGSWYDYWTGERLRQGVSGGALDLEQRDKVIAQKPLMVKPTLDLLPVYVRGGNHPADCAADPKHQRKRQRARSPCASIHRQREKPARARSTPTTATPSTSATATSPVSISPARSQMTDHCMCR